MTVAASVTAGDSPLELIRDRTAASRRYDAEALAAMLEHEDAVERTCSAAGDGLAARSAHRAHAMHEISRAVRLSERTVANLLSAAREVRNHLPRCWRGFLLGGFDRTALRAIASVSTDITDPQALETLDRDAASAAARMTPGRLRSWLNRRIARLTPADHQRAVEQARAQRCVRITHLSDGVSHVEALLATPVAAAIEQRIRAVARSAEAPVPQEDARRRRLDGTDHPQEDPSDADGGAPLTRTAGDGRTLDQREADLFAAWLLDGRRLDDVEVDASIAIMIPEATLTGDSEAPGISADRSWTIPAEEARRLAGSGGGPSRGHRWYEIRHGRADGVGGIGPVDDDGLGLTGVEADLLSVVYAGRYPPEHLRRALSFRDGTCRASGCVVPAARCDVDHRTPYPQGPTTAENLQMLCRRHHRMKSHGLLTGTDPPHRPG